MNTTNPLSETQTQSDEANNVPASDGARKTYTKPLAALINATAKTKGGTPESFDGCCVTAPS